MRSVAYKNDNPACFRFLVMSPDPFFFFFFFSFWFPEHNSATVRNILMVLGRITGQVNAECRMQE